MDKPAKVMSKEYDLIYVQEATELTLDEWETLTTRLRWGVLPVQQLIGDCNPNAPTHWLKQRADAGLTVMLDSRHEDNPTVTSDYMAKLDALTGVRYLRLRKGIWAAAEGMVFDNWDRGIHLIGRRDLPIEWPRDLAIDFGYTNPFVAQCWAEDPDGRLYLEWEIYKTQTLVEDHARMIVDRLGGKKPREIICDHDAEGRATFMRVTGWHTINADKAVTAGIQDVQSRFAKAGDGQPRIFLMEDARIHPADPILIESHKPTCTAEEIESYVWDDAKVKEQPVKADDHGCDAMRYECKRRSRRYAPSMAYQDGARI
jgi:phage terminase large subunit